VARDYGIISSLVKITFKFMLRVRVPLGRG
jgi:hypothetical protein